MRFRQRVFKKRIISMVLATVVAFVTVLTTPMKSYGQGLNHSKITQQTQNKSVALKSSDSYYINKDIIKNAKRLRVGATAYTNDPITSTGTKPTEGRTIAVDPRVIPYGTVLIINGQEYVAEDCGAWIQGNDIDIYFESHEEADKFGVQYMEVFTWQ